MAVYVLLFRGVGGKTQLPTKPLSEALTELGFENAGTVVLRLLERAEAAV